MLMPVIGWNAPESPSWLGLHGKTDEAFAVVDRIEAAISTNGQRSLPPVGPAMLHPMFHHGRFVDRFRDGYAARALCIWMIVFCISASGNALITWLPTIYATAYHVRLTSTFLLSTTLGVASLAGAISSIVLIDSIGRRRTFMTALFGSAALCDFGLGRSDADANGGIPPDSWQLHDRAALRRQHIFRPPGGYQMKMGVRR
jgi:putative MFS transporter